MIMKNNKGKKSNRGGARAGAGRKEITDRLVTINVNVRTSKVEKIGSAAAVREVCHKAIDQAAGMD